LLTTAADLTGETVTKSDREIICAVRRCWFERRLEAAAFRLSQQVVGAEGSLIRVVPGRVGAALTKPGRASTARWCGSGEHDAEEYARNRRS
jgi:hypothetical protein